MKNGRENEVSVLIAAHNAATFISSALASVKDQSMIDWEIVVVEDGPSDGTDAIVREFARKHSGHRIVYDQLEKHLGVAAARNRTLELCQGSVIAFLDADDVWKPDHISSMLNKLREGHVLAFSPVSIWDSSEEKELCVYTPTLTQIRYPNRNLFSKSFIQTCSCVALSKETIVRVGVFDESLQIGEDRDYWFRAVEHRGSIGCTKDPTCRYVKHLGSSMAKTLLVAEQCVKFYEKHIKTTCVPSWYARCCFAGALRTYARLSRRENASNARKMLLRAWRIWPFGIDLPLRALL